MSKHVVGNASKIVRFYVEQLRSLNTRWKDNFGAFTYFIRIYTF